MCAVHKLARGPSGLRGCVLSGHATAIPECLGIQHVVRLPRWALPSPVRPIWRLAEAVVLCALALLAFLGSPTVMNYRDNPDHESHDRLRHLQCAFVRLVRGNRSTGREFAP